LDGALFNAFDIRTAARIRRQWRFIRVIDPGKPFQFSAPRPQIKPLRIALFTNRKRRIHKNLKERNRRITAQLVAQTPIRRNRRDNHHSPLQSFVHGKLIDAAHILFAIRAAKTQIAANRGAQLVAIQHPALNAPLCQRRGQRIGQRRLASGA